MNEPENGETNIILILLEDSPMVNVYKNMLVEVTNEYGELIRDDPHGTPGGQIVPFLREVAEIYQELHREPNEETFRQCEELTGKMRALIAEVRHAR